MDHLYKSVQENHSYQKPQIGLHQTTLVQGLSWRAVHLARSQISSKFSSLSRSCWQFQSRDCQTALRKHGADIEKCPLLLLNSQNYFSYCSQSSHTQIHNLRLQTQIVLYIITPHLVKEVEHRFWQRIYNRVCWHWAATVHKIRHVSWELWQLLLFRVACHQ